MPADFPSVDRNHLISSASKVLFAWQRPSTWEPDFRDGDNDFGFDIEIQVAPQAQVCHTFRAQLKGTESPSISKDGTTLNIALRRTTLNLYANTLDPVMLVVAVVKLSENGKPDPATSRVYWQWLAVELQRLRGSSFAIDQSSQESVTLHVPLSNELTPDLDVVPYLRTKVGEARAVEGLAALVRSAVDATSGRLDDPIQQLLSVIADDPSRLLSLLTLDDDEEASPSEGTPQSVIAAAISHLRAGKTTLAEDVVHRLDRTQFEAMPKLKASLLSLEGKIAMQRMRKADALRLFEDAYHRHPVEKHLLAQEEVRFLKAVDRSDKQAMSAIAKALAGVRTDDGLGLLVRVQVSLGEFDAASEAIARIGQSNRALPTLVLLSGQHKWADVQVQADHALSQPGISERDAMGLRLIAAGACWQQALAPASLSPDDTEIPLTGPPGLDTKAAEAAWQYSAACLRGLKELGWPPNIELLAPLAVASATAIGRQDQALPMLKEAAVERPEYLVLQENLELLAISSENNEVALEANSRQPQVHEVLVRRACLLFKARQYTECLSAASKVASGVDAPCKQTPVALAMGSAAAVKLARTDDANQLMAALSNNAAWGEFAYFAKFAQQSMDTGDQATPLAALREGLLEFPTSRLLASNLYSNLRVEETTAATEAILLSRLLRQGAALTLEECVHLIAAHFTLGQWQDAESEARAAARFGETGRLMSMLAVAVEMQGKTAEAVGILERVVSSGHHRLDTLRNYLGLCLRLGRMDSALDTIEKLLGVGSDRDDRLELLRLDALILAQQGLNDRAQTVAKELGRLVDPEVEIEEGMYLNVYMAVTLNNESISDTDRQAFWRRVEAFCTKWPESRLFRRVTMPERGLTTLDDLHDMLDGVLGDSRQQLRTFQERERQARGGDLPVPFVARPGFVFHYIGDCFTLWDVAKRSRPEDRQFHLTSALIDEARSTERVLRDVPLLDLTALLVLHDLGLFGTLFAMFRRIAVPRRTVDYISQNARGLLVNPGVVSAASSLLAAINENLHRIDEPSSGRVAVKAMNPRDLLDDYRHLAGLGRWAVYTDDAITRNWIRADHTSLNHLCTVDFLALADNRGLLTPVEVASHLEQLASWNVGITVASRYLIAALDGTLGGSTFLTGSERLDRFYDHPPFAKLARAVWYFEKDPKDLIRHIGALVAEMLARPRTEEESAAAVWAFWFIRVRMAPGLDSLGWNPLCFSLMMAIRQLPFGAVPRAVSTFLKVVEIVVGPDRMMQSEQETAIGDLGKLVGTVARTNLAEGERLRFKVAIALPQRTADGDTFNEAYLAALSESTGAK